MENVRIGVVSTVSKKLQFPEDLKIHRTMSSKCTVRHRGIGTGFFQSAGQATSYFLLCQTGKVRCTPGVCVRVCVCLSFCLSVCIYRQVGNSNQVDSRYHRDIHTLYILVDTCVCVCVFVCLYTGRFFPCLQHIIFLLHIIFSCGLSG